MTADEEWARHLLAGLPAPRMPDDVRSRLASAIADEAAQSAQAAQAAQAAPPAQVPMQRQRALRRRPVLAGLIGAATVLTLFAVVDPLAMDGHDQSDSTVAGPESADPGVGPPVGSDAETAILLASATAYNRANFEAQAVHTANRAASQGSFVAPGSKAAETLGSRSGPAHECAAAVPDPQGALEFIDLADFEGKSALIVAFRSDDRLDVVVQNPSCTRTDPAVVYRVTVEAPRADGE